MYHSVPRGQLLYAVSWNAEPHVVLVYNKALLALVMLPW